MNKLSRTMALAGLITWLGAVNLSTVAVAQTAPAAASPAAASTIPAQTAQGLETIAYSEAVQAMVFTLPLFITERERLARAKLTRIGEGRNPLEAPINQFGHMGRWVTAAEKDLPISPNNDTVYSGAVIDLAEEPIILQTPDITDRFFTVEIFNAYIDNLPYMISTRVNGGKAATLAIVGPNWKGSLPAGMQVLHANTSLVIIGPRIRISGEDDVAAAVKYQKQMTLLPLSEYLKGPGVGKPKLAAPRNRPEYKDEFAYFRRMVDLLTDYPPLAQDAAAVELMKHIGIEAGKPFNPDHLLPQARAGLLRAVKDLPALREGIRYSRGTETANHWRTNPDGGRYGLNYVARAEMALVGLASNDAEEATYLQTFVDRDGATMNSRNNYVLHLTPDQIPKVLKNGFWSITMYDAYRFQFVENPINRYKIGNLDKLKANADGSVDIYLQAKTPGADLESNWLPAPSGDKDFKTTIRIYGPAPGEWEWSRLSQFPAIRKVTN